MLLGAASCKSRTSSHVDDALRWSICISLPLTTQTALLSLWASGPHLPNSMKAQGPWEQGLCLSLFEYPPMLRGVTGKSSVLDGWISNLPVFSRQSRQWHGGETGRAEPRCTVECLSEALALLTPLMQKDPFSNGHTHPLACVCFLSTSVRIRALRRITGLTFPTAAKRDSGPHGNEFVDIPGPCTRSVKHTIGSRGSLL